METMSQFSVIHFSVSGNVPQSCGRLFPLSYSLLISHPQLLNWRSARDLYGNLLSKSVLKQEKGTTVTGVRFLTKLKW